MFAELPNQSSLLTMPTAAMLLIPVEFREIRFTKVPVPESRKTPHCLIYPIPDSANPSPHRNVNQRNVSSRLKNEFCHTVFKKNFVTDGKNFLMYRKHFAVDGNNFVTDRQTVVTNINIMGRNKTTVLKAR